MIAIELSIEERLKLAEETHKDFTDIMWKNFGLTIHPGYCIVGIKPLLCSGGYSEPQEISLNDVLLYEREIRETVCHETGHFLHPFMRNHYKKGAEIPIRNYLLGEIIANLGTMTYIDLKYGTGRINEFTDLLENQNYAVLIASDIFKNDKALLGKITNIDMNKAKRLIVPHLNRSLDLKKNPYN